MISFILLSQFAISLQPPTSLYEITTRPYLYLLSQKLNKQCKLRDIPEEEFDSWKEKGFEWVWFMGIWKLGESGLRHDQEDADCRRGYDENCPGWTRDDVIGSPYAIVEYTVNPEIGTIEDVKWIREQLHKRGIKLMLDFVPNHSAFEAPEISTNKNFYIYTNKRPLPSTNRFAPNGIAYGTEGGSSPWTDVAQYNYFDMSFRNHQVSVLKFIASVADGVRCDMSHCVINSVFEDCWREELKELKYETPKTEFWTDAIAAVKSEYPSFIFLAESYHDHEPELVNFGFDYAYDKIPYDKLRDGQTQEFIQQISSRSRDYKSHGCFFTENHDERRAVAVFGNIQKANAAAACLLTLPGMRFFNQEQWNGPRNKIDVHLRRANSEDPNAECIQFYNKLFDILKLNCMKNGEFTQLNVEGATIPAWSYTLENERILVTVNYNPVRSGGWVRLPYAPNGEIIALKEMISGITYYRNGEEARSKGLLVVLDPYQVQIFKY